MRKLVDGIHNRWEKGRTPQDLGGSSRVKVAGACASFLDTANVLADKRLRINLRTGRLAP